MIHLNTPELSSVDPHKSSTSASTHHSGHDQDLVHGGKVMSVTEHLDELRRRIMTSLWAVVILFILAFVFANDIIKVLEQPLLEVLPAGQRNLHFTGTLDVFMTSLKVAILIGVITACPVWIYQFWKFFEPALYPSEKRYIQPFILVSIVMFALGISFCYFVILPSTLDFLIKMGTDIAIPIISIKDYIHFLMLMLFGFGLIFETPVLIVLLGLLDILSVESLRNSRRVVFVIILIVAAIVTPSPDPFTQMALAIPVYGMYEGAILILKKIKKNDANALETKNK
jgi:sec-independent protein translocase protein TatC